MTLLTHSDLDRARQEADPFADAVIAELGSDAWTVSALLRKVHKNDDRLPSALPAVVAHFCNELSELPAWCDDTRIRRAQAWAAKHLLHVTTALFCASLPSAYGAARGARVLAASGRMQAATLDRRVNETAQFVLEVVAPGGFLSSGAALRSVQKVRLMHAAVRAHLRNHPDFLDERPINQEDMAGTLFTFSVVVLRALRRLGAHVSDEAAEDYYHLWRAVAALLGVQERLLPADLWSASDLSARVAARQFQSSEHGRQLMAALLTRMEQHVPHARFAPTHLVRYLVGDALAEQLGLPHDDAFQAKLTLLRLLPSSSQKVAHQFARKLSALLGQPLLRSVVLVKLNGAPADFELPHDVMDT